MHFTNLKSIKSKAKDAKRVWVAVLVEVDVI
jgi:hypothetical protein